MVDKTLVRALGVQAYELSAARLVLTVGETSRLDPGKVLALAQKRGSRWKLAPDNRLSYTFSDAEKTDRLPAARARLLEIGKCVS